MIQHTYIALITLSLLLVIMRWRKMAISNYNNMRPVAWIAVLVCVLQVVLNFVFHDPSCVFFNRNNLNDAPVADGHQSLAISTPQSETAVVSRIATRRGNSKSNELPVLERYYDVCVVGAGLSGSVISERYANLRDANVLIVERRDHIGGNCYDYIDQDTGIRVSKYGAHLFHVSFMNGANVSSIEITVVGFVFSQHQLFGKLPLDLLWSGEILCATIFRMDQI
jgi:hypothetical protein